MEADKGSGIGGVPMGDGTTTIAVKRTRGRPTRSSARLWNQTLPLEVFSNHLLREKIVECLVLDAGCTTNDSRKAACSLRLVNKTWNETVIKVLYKNLQPLFVLFSRRGPKNLVEFCNTFASSAIYGFIPPFVINIVVLHSEIIRPLSNLLTHCGEGLVELVIRTNAMGNQYKGEFPQWSLGRLRRLEIRLDLSLSLPLFVGGVGGIASFGQDGQPENAGSRLIKSILRDATAISKFTMTMFSSRGPVAHPLSNWSFFESVNLPATISSVQIVGGRMRNRDFGMLATQHLPNLTWLNMTDVYDYDLLDTDSFFKTLDNFRASLKTISIHGYNYPILPVNPIALRFPVMEKLENFTVKSVFVELESIMPSLHSSFPKMHTLRLYNQTQDMIHKLTRNPFTSVTNLEFRLIDENFSFAPNHKFVKTLSMETMQRVNFAFPNVRNLELGLSGRDTSGLEYLFREVTQLTELKLNYYGDETKLYADFWDAVLIGVPIETVAESRGNPDFWQRNELNEEETFPSVKNLRELTSLNLCDDRDIFTRRRQDSYSSTSFISDVTFHQAFLKMPNLKRLYLKGGFMASDEMTAEWINEGRYLVYNVYNVCR